MKDKHYEYTQVALIGREILTPRQKELVMLVCDGLNNTEIAEHMGLSVNTVENHRNLVMVKLKQQGVHNVATLVKWAIVTETYKL